MSCKAKSRSGEQCKKPPMPGLEVCRLHGGSAPRARAKSALILAHAQHVAHRKFAEPIEADDWEADPINSFTMEFRRTIGWIRYYENCIEKLESDTDLIWGVRKRELKSATEFAGTDETEEATPNVLIELLFRERRFLHEMQKTYINAGLITKRMEMERELMDRIEIAVSNTVRALGRDPSDPEVRKVVRDNLIAVSG